MMIQIPLFFVILTLIDQAAGDHFYEHQYRIFEASSMRSPEDRTSWYELLKLVQRNRGKDAIWPRLVTKADYEEGKPMTEVAVRAQEDDLVWPSLMTKVDDEEERPNKDVAEGRAREDDLVWPSLMTKVDDDEERPYKDEAEGELSLIDSMKRWMTRVWTCLKHKLLFSYYTVKDEVCDNYIFGRCVPDNRPLGYGTTPTPPRQMLIINGWSNPCSELAPILRNPPHIDENLKGYTIFRHYFNKLIHYKGDEFRKWSLSKTQYIIFCSGKENGSEELILGTLNRFDGRYRQPDISGKPSICLPVTKHDSLELDQINTKLEKKLTQNDFNGRCIFIKWDKEFAKVSNLVWPICDVLLQFYQGKNASCRQKGKGPSYDEISMKHTVTEGKRIY